MWAVWVLTHRAALSWFCPFEVSLVSFGKALLSGIDEKGKGGGVGWGKSGSCLALQFEVGETFPNVLILEPSTLPPLYPVIFLPGAEGCGPRPSVTLPEWSHGLQWPVTPLIQRPTPVLTSGDPPGAQPRGDG